MRDGNTIFIISNTPSSLLVLEVTMRDGNYIIYSILAHRKSSFRSDYEGWKLSTSSGERPRRISFRSDYEGWKQKNKTRIYKHIRAHVLEVTMRDGNL